MEMQEGVIGEKCEEGIEFSTVWVLPREAWYSWEKQSAQRSALRGHYPYSSYSRPTVSQALTHLVDGCGTFTYTTQGIRTATCSSVHTSNVALFTLVM